MVISKITVDSKSEMIEYLRKCDSDYILLGENSEVEGGVYIFEADISDEVEFTIGIITEGHGIEPECIYVNNTLLVGFNKEIHLLTIGNYERKIINAESLFYEFVPIIDSNKIIAIFELEIICFSMKGNIYWRYYSDVINEYSVENTSLNIVTELGKESISLLTGEKI